MTHIGGINSKQPLDQATRRRRFQLARTRAENYRMSWRTVRLVSRGARRLPAGAGRTGQPVVLLHQDSRPLALARAPAEVGQGDNVQDCLPDVVGPTFGQWNPRSEAGRHVLLSIRRRRRLYADAEVSV